jgi:hypothetical protein
VVTGGATGVAGTAATARTGTAAAATVVDGAGTLVGEVTPCTPASWGRAKEVAPEALREWTSRTSCTMAAFSAATGVDGLPAVAATTATGAAMADRAATLVIRARRAARGGLVVLGGLLTPGFLLGTGTRAEVRKLVGGSQRPLLGWGAALKGGW